MTDTIAHLLLGLFFGLLLGIEVGSRMGSKFSASHIKTLVDAMRARAKVIDVGDISIQVAINLDGSTYHTTSRLTTNQIEATIIEQWADQRGLVLAPRSIHHDKARTP